MNRVVVHFLDGHLLKGFTNDFLPAKDHFHLGEEGQPPGTKPAQVRVADLKALFFVKTFAGDPSHQEVSDLSTVKARPGRAIRVVFLGCRPSLISRTTSSSYLSTLSCSGAVAREPCRSKKTRRGLSSRS